MDTLTLKDHGEAVALYRSEIVGSLTRRELDHGELAAELTALSLRKFRPPRAHSPRAYSVPTLERWYYAYKEGGLSALRPHSRTDRGRGRDLTDAQRTLLLAIRQEYPHASVPLILRTLVAEGHLQEGTVSKSTVRRFYQQQGLDKASLRAALPGGKIRLRWQAERPGALWQGDVCHATPLVIDGKSTPVRVHALLDDASRLIIAIEAKHAEREVDMLELMVRAVRQHGVPDALYLDNGATYRGHTLALACARMHCTLLHAKPYDAPARGKMERFWRTLREGCLDFCHDVASLHELNMRLYAFVDEHYHKVPHASLMGRSPSAVYEATPRPPDAFDEAKLRAALTVHERRRVRRDSTLAMDGEDWETTLGFLAGKLVTVSRCLVDPSDPPWIEHEGKTFPLHRVDAIRNATRPRAQSSLDTPHPARVDFAPHRALVDKTLGRVHGTKEGGAS